MPNKNTTVTNFQELLQLSPLKLSFQDINFEDTKICMFYPLKTEHKYELPAAIALYSSLIAIFEKEKNTAYLAYHNREAKVISDLSASELKMTDTQREKAAKSDPEYMVYKQKCTEALNRVVELQPRLNYLIDCLRVLTTGSMQEIKLDFVDLPPQTHQSLSCSASKAEKAQTVLPKRTAITNNIKE